MFGKIAGFELRYQLKSPVFWVVAVIFFLMTFGAATIDQIRIGGGGNIHKNAPYAIAQTHLILAIFYMFVTTAFVANVVVRDDETGFGPILRSTRIRKFDYLYGRFTGAFLAAAISFLVVPLAIFVGSFMPWVDPERLGPNDLNAYLFSYFALALPAILLTSAIFFALATVTRSMMWTYVGVIAFLVLYIIAGIALDRPEYEKGAALWEPLGTAAFGLATKYWTASERNSLTPPLAGALLFNRVFVLVLAAGFLALAYSLFRFQSAELSGQRKSPAFFVLLFLGLANAMGALWFATEAGRYGGVVYPVTRILLFPLLGSFGLIPIIIAIYYSGELVWREREKKTHEIIDATPVPDWAFVAPKTLAISLVLISTLLISVVAAMLSQVFHGYFNFELEKYLLWYVLPQALDFILLAVLAVFLQTISPHKFIGWALMVIYIVSTITFTNLGFEHKLYNYGATTETPFSDMNGLGKFWMGAWWLRAYWTAFALVLLVLAYGLWRRGTESRLLPRLRRLPLRLNGGAGALMGVSLVAFAGLGGFIYVNTNVWNEYRTNIDGEKWQAEYEKTLLPFENTPQPKIIAQTLDIDIQPHAPSLETKGSYVLENKTGAALKEIHVRFDRDLEVKGLSIEGARPKKTFEKFNYRIFAFDTPMAPGEQRKMSFITLRAQRGFPNSGAETRVVDNGTFVNNLEIAPILGMSRDGLLTDRAKRRKYGLPPEQRMAKLGDVSSMQFNGLRKDADFIQSDITVTTVADQTPIAPGYKVSDSVRNGRRTARFVTEAPIMPFVSIQSARYKVAEETYKGVQLAVYYDPQHAWNIDRMKTSMKRSLDYMGTNFSPYQFRQLRYQEFPDYAQFAQSFANTIPWSEGMFFISDYRDPTKIDMVTYVGAHEIGHQWWAHQVIGANQQGGAMLSETFAQYSALMVMKHTYGEDQIRKFLKFELDSYLRARGGDVIDEQPLYKVENQPYIYYRKGSLVMYRLQDQIGEEAVNRALRKLIADHAFKGAPYPTTLDFMAALRAEAPADKQALITDLFEKITLYDLKTKSAAVKKRADGKFDVTVVVEAQKKYADGKGKETVAALNETMEIGLFTAKPGDKGFVAKNVVLYQRRPIRSGENTFTFIVDKAPTFAGIDPYNTVIDRNGDDNTVKVGG